MTVTVRVPAALRELCDGRAALDLDVADPVTVARVLDALATAHPMLERRVRDERGTIRQHVNLFVGADNVRDLGGGEVVIPPGHDLSIIPAVSGG